MHRYAISRIKIMQKTSSFIFVFIVLAIISVAVRWVNINTPYSQHREANAAIAIGFMRFWWHNGAINEAFLLNATRDGAANRYINNHARLRDDTGRWYYTSYPPFGWIAPYLVFRSLGIYPDILPIQVFSLCLHFLTAGMLALIMRRLPVNDSHSVSNYAACIMAVLAYLFSPMFLWYHCNTYATYPLKQPIHAGIVLCFLWFTATNNASTRNVFLLQLATAASLFFFFTYTVWLGVFVAAGLAITALYHWKFEKKGWLIACVGIGASGAAVIATFAHYSLIAGIEPVIKQWTDKAASRTGYFDTADHGFNIFQLNSWRVLANYYKNGYSYFLVMLLAEMLILFFLRGVKNRESYFKFECHILLTGLIVGPAVVRHLAFFNSDVVHDHSVMPLGIAISLYCGIFFQEILHIVRLEGGLKRWRSRLSVIIALAAIVTVLSVWDYRKQNNKRHSLYLDIGSHMKKQARDDEVVFLDPTSKVRGLLLYEVYNGVVEELVFYSGRNITVWSSRRSAYELMQANRCEKGVIFKIGSVNGKVQINAQRFSSHQLANAKGVANPEEIKRERLLTERRDDRKYNPNGW